MATLKALTCSCCGAPLEGVEERSILICGFCGQSHTFVPPPPPEKPNAQFAPGERVAVEWGHHWWPASVLELVGNHEFRVHFDGWGPQYDLVVGPSRIRHISHATFTAPTRRVGLVVAIVVAATIVVAGASAFVAMGGSSASNVAQAGGPGDRSATYTRGQAVEIWWGSTWYAGRILDVNGSEYKITYDGYSSSWDEWLDASRLRGVNVPAEVVQVAKPDPAKPKPKPTPTPTPTPPQASYERGQLVMVEWKGSWYKGRILEVKGESYKITYDGYSSSWDEWVGPTRLENR